MKITVRNDMTTLTCEVIAMGKDIQLCVYGGDAPHIGSVAFAEWHERLRGEGESATSSVINRIGHKDEQIGRAFAEAAARELRCAVAVSCGIHVDNITTEQIEAVVALSKELLEQTLYEMKEKIVNNHCG